MGRECPEASSLLREWMGHHEQEMVDFLGRIVNIDSATLNREGVETLAMLAAQELNELGFSVDWHDPVQPPYPWIDHIYLEGMGASGIARSVRGRLAGGTGQGSLLLMGHLDTAFPPGAPTVNPFRIENGRVYGPAVADMKGGVVGLLFACRALIETGVLRPHDITVVFNSDEQAGSVCTRGLVEREARRVNWALVAEPGRVGGQVVGQRGGLALGQVLVEGVEAHVGTGFREGRSAIEALCRKVVAFYGLHDPEGGVVLNVGEIRGGARRNLFARRAEARFDLRVTSMPVWDRVSRRIEEIAAAEEVLGTGTELHLHLHRPPTAWTEQTDRLAVLVAESAREMGMQIDTVPTMSASDANLIAGQGTPVLCGLGPVGGAVMTSDEYIELPTLAERAALVATLASKLAQGRFGTATVEAEAGRGR